MRWTQKNFLIGCGFLIVSLIFIFFLIPAQVKTIKNAYDFQPSFFPYFACITMAVLSVILMVSNLIKDRMLLKDLFINIKAGLSKESLKIAGNVAVIFVLFCLYLVLFNKIGFIAATAIILPSMMFIMGWRKPVSLVIITALVIVGLYFFFDKVMLVHLS